MKKKQVKYRLCRTVGSLIKELEKLPKSTKLTEPMRPTHYNTSGGAKDYGLKPCVGFEDD